MTAKPMSCPRCGKADPALIHTCTPTVVTDGSPVRLWLDDVRDPVAHGKIGWLWVKTADHAIAWLETGRVVEASLDHDLDMMATIGETPTEKTGYDVVCWMEANDVYPERGVRVHSQNPSGKARMLAGLAALLRRRAQH